jgi:hypothetical protein
MAEATQYSFGLLEVAETLIKKQAMHEGKWILGVGFTLNIGFMGRGTSRRQTRRDGFRVRPKT